MAAVAVPAVAVVAVAVLMAAVAAVLPVVVAVVAAAAVAVAAVAVAAVAVVVLPLRWLRCRPWRLWCVGVGVGGGGVGGGGDGAAAPTVRGPRSTALTRSLGRTRRSRARSGRCSSWWVGLVAMPSLTAAAGLGPWLRTRVPPPLTV